MARALNFITFGWYITLYVNITLHKYHFAYINNLGYSVLMGLYLIVKALKITKYEMTIQMEF